VSKLRLSHATTISCQTVDLESNVKMKRC